MRTIAYTGAAVILLTATIATNDGPLIRSPAAIPDRQVELVMDQQVPVQKPSDPIDKQTIALVIPMNLTPGSDEEEVQRMVLDHNLQNFVEGRYIKNQELVESAQKVQEALKPSFSLGGEPNGVQHKVDLHIEAFQSRAKLNYSGYLKSDVVYTAEHNNVEVSVYEDLSPRTRLGVEHKSENDLSRVKIDFSF